MSNERIHRIVEKLEELWSLYPDLRLGQLLENFVYSEGERGDRTSKVLFYQKDDITERRIDKLLERSE